MSDDVRGSFTATHHALLFAWISRAVVERVGEERGEAVMRKAVRRYGEERGRRMALRARADGQGPTMASFLAYGEWTVAPSEIEQAIIEEGPDVKMLVYECPWHTAWAENGLTAYGRFYCLEIDEALVRGFNAALRLDVNRTQTNDGGYCEFVFHEVEQRIPRRGVIMPWNYHTGHLYRTVGEVIIEELEESGQEAIGAALAAFAERYGDEAVEVVVRYRNTDFNSLPG